MAVKGTGTTVIRDGKVVSSTDTWDMLEMLMQLGLGPKVDKRKAMPRRLIEEVYNGGNFGVIDELLENQQDRTRLFPIDVERDDSALRIGRF